MTTGFLYFSDDLRHGFYIEERGRFTDVLPSAPKVEELQLALIALDSDEIHFSAVMRRGRKAASLKWLVSFEAVEPFEPPVRIADLISRLDPKVGELLTTTVASKGSQLAQDSWVQVRDAIDSMQGDGNLVAREQALVFRRPRATATAAEPVVEYEHDAVGVALNMSGIDRKPILDRWTGSNLAPFLTGLDEFRLLEDRMIDFDATVFGEWVRESSSLVGLATFQQRGRKLTIVNVNRTDVEHALGVDLVYYNHHFDAYVLVQYKRMRQHSTAGHEYRPDDQLEKELERMRSLSRSATAACSPSDYRLNDSGMFLKLCPSTSRSLEPSGLIRGMYLPLEYWDLALASDLTLGVRGGRVVTFDNIGRHMSNSLFVELVGSGWIGSRGLTSANIAEIVRSSLSVNKSVMLAEARRVDAR